MDFASRAFQLRPAWSDVFRFAWSLYEELMKPLTVELLGRWNEAGQKQVVELALANRASADRSGQQATLIILKDELDIGWMHVIESLDTFYLGQLYIGTLIIVGGPVVQVGLTITMEVRLVAGAGSLLQGVATSSTLILIILASFRSFHTRTILRAAMIWRQQMYPLSA